MSGGVICDTLHLAYRISDTSIQFIPFGYTYTIASLVDNFPTSLHPHPPLRHPALRSSVAVPFAYFQISLDTLGSISFLTNLNQKRRRPPLKGVAYIYISMTQRS